MTEKKRINCNVKLKEKDIPDIISLGKKGWMIEEIAKKYGVVGSTIRKIFENKNWTHITGGKLNVKLTNGKRGENHGSAKLKERDILDIVSLGKSGWSTSEIAKKYNVKSSAIYMIFINRTWTHITGGKLNVKLVEGKRGHCPPSVSKKDVLEIRKCLKRGETYRSIAKKFKISSSTVFNIYHNKFCWGKND